MSNRHKKDFWFGSSVCRFRSNARADTFLATADTNCRLSSCGMETLRTARRYILNATFPFTVVAEEVCIFEPQLYHLLHSLFFSTAAMVLSWPASLLWLLTACIVANAAFQADNPSIRQIPVSLSIIEKLKIAIL